MATTVSSSQDVTQSKLSATALAEVPPRTIWNYVQDRKGRTMTEPVVGFYFKPPQGAKCRWSTDNGAHKAQHLQFGLQLPRRTLILWDDEKLETEAAFYRERYWEDMKTLTAPQRFEDLYEYFDSATMWMHGALNYWNLINLLVADARTNWHEHENRVAAECNAWVLDWLEHFPAAHFNRENLMRWNQKTDILTAVTTQYDWSNDLKDLDMVSQNILRECLLFHFQRLTGKKPVVACFNHHASAATDKVIPPPVAAPAQDPVVATAESAPSSVPNDQPMLEPGSPLPQGLATIPEHASLVKASAKANGLTIDTTALTNIPKHTVSAPVTAVPSTTVTPHIPEEAEDSPDQKDDNASTNDELFNPQTMAEKIEVRARQLSAQSAPGEKSELGPNTHINSQARAASATPIPAIPSGPKRHTIVTSFTGDHHEMHEPHYGGLPKSPPRGTPGSRQGVANVPTYYLSQRPMAQQGAPMGLSPPHQHMMPPFRPHNNMQQPHAGFVPSAPAQGLPPRPHALTARGPPAPPPLGAGMPPMGPPGAPFQSQVRMPLPHIDMHPFNNPQGHPTSAPLQYMAQRNVGTPMYQPNGYIAQPQHQPSGVNGNKKVKQNGRRDSENSNGSRKLRDDPLHGPVYAMNHRKSSNAPSGAPSGVRKPSLANPEQTPRGSFGRCINEQTGDFREMFQKLFDECTCARCMEASRSVFVKHGDSNLTREAVVAALMLYFSNWEPMSVKIKPNNTSALVVFNSDHNAVSAIQSFWSAGRKSSIPELSESTFVWYPMYSKHYNPKPRNHTGAPRGLVEAQNASRRLSGSSAKRRGSNPYLGQRPVFNNPNFGKDAPSLQQLQYLCEQRQASGQPSVNNMQTGAMHTIPYQLQPPQKSQRTLWQPPTDDNRRKSTITPSAKASKKEEQLCSPKTRPMKPAKAPLKREDWRSKPPSEEAIEDLSDEVAVADTTSNVSSQGTRDIKICLPNETGSARSRSASPDVEGTTIQEQAKVKASPKVEAKPQEEPEKIDGETYVEENTTEDNGNKSSPKSSEAMPEAVRVVEELQPTAAPELMQADKKDGHKTDYTYSKVTSEITEPTEAIDISTVIHHKPQRTRTPLPTNWNPEPIGNSSDLGRRFGALQNEIEGEIQSEIQDNHLANALMGRMLASEVGDMEGTDAATAPKAPAGPAPHEESQVKQPKKKGAKSKKKKAQVTTDALASRPSSNTPSEAQSRGPSRASIGRPESRASTKRPQSASGNTAESSAQPSSKMKKHKNDQMSGADGAPPPQKKRNKQKKRKQVTTTEAPAGLEGQAKTGGSQDQDQGRAVSGQESPKKKPKTIHPALGPAEEASASEPISKAQANDTQHKVVEQQAVSKDVDYRAHAGGSLRMKKNRSPTKLQQKVDQEKKTKTPTKNESKSLQTVFEPPSEENRKDISPDANLFPHQKFAIDQARASAAPKMGMRNKGNAFNLTTATTRIGSLPLGFNPYPQLPPNTKPSAWSNVAKRNANDDPFSSGNSGYDQSKHWMNEKVVMTVKTPPVKPPRKPCYDGKWPTSTSPTRSPDKRPRHQSSKSKVQLNAAAKVFTPLSSPTRSVASLRLTTAGHTKAAPAPLGGAGATTGDQGRSASTTAGSSFAKQPIVARGSATPGLKDGKPIPHHAKKPSLPSQAGSTDARFITPAEQILDPTKAEQPGAPGKDKKKKKITKENDERTTDVLAPERGSSNNPAQQRKPATAQMIAVAVAADDNAPALGNDYEFPTLAVAAAVPRKQSASFAQAAATNTTATTTAPAPAIQKENVKPTSPVTAPATSPSKARLGRRGAVSGPASAPAPAPVPPAKEVGTQEKPTEDDWTTVKSSKKLAGRNPTTSRTTAAGGRGGKSAQHSNRGGGDGGRAPVGEERKGG